LGHSYIELGKAVLRGDIRIQDIDGDDRANMIWIQDYATQVGQGPLSERKSEHLIRSDIGLVLYRTIWQREVMALAQGKPTKQWRRSEQVIGSEDE
jgi:hypothetical protein